MTRLMQVAVVGILIAWGVAGCGSDPNNNTPGPDASSACANKKCGATCCSTGQTCDNANLCCTPTSCEASPGVAKECGDDGCGTSCGTCGTGTTCNESTWKCTTCTSETKLAFCGRLAQAGKVCGSVVDKDNCTHQPRTEDCGDTCAASGKTCDPAANTCTGPCQKKSVADFCAGFCGSYTALECGENRTEGCGACTNGQPCVNNTCGCTYEGDPAFCARMAKAGKVCGSIADKDNCLADKAVNCGTAACTGGTACLPNNTCGNCTTEDKAGYCARMAKAGKDCGSIADKDNCGAARTEDCGDTCASGKTCVANACTKQGAPANDSCAGAVDITAAAMPVSGTTVGATDDSAGSCEDPSYPQDGADVVYKLTIPGPDHKAAKIKITRGAASSSYYPAVYLRKTCADAASEVACSPYGTGGVSQIDVSDLAPGDYFITVDGEAASEGAFQLEVTLSTPIPAPANDNCTGAAVIPTTPLDASGNGTLTVQGDTTSAKSDSQSLGSCGGMGNDLVYSLTTDPAKGNKDVTVTLTFTDTTQHPVVYLRKGACITTTSTDEMKCNSNSSGNVATFLLRGVAGGTYFLWADGYSSSKGAFTMTVAIADAAPAPSNDACGTAGASAQPIALDPAGHGTASGDTSLALGDDAKGSCEYSTGLDLVYLVDTSALGERNLTAKVTFASSSSYASVFVRKVCDSAVATDEVACNHGSSSTASAIVRHLAAGKYYVWVDQSKGGEGAFDLIIDAVVPPPPATNDKCDATGVGAQAITLDSAGHATLAGDTTTATDDDAQGTCEYTSGKDLVYVVDTTGLGVRTLTAKVSFADTSASATVYVRTICNSAAGADELACDHPASDIASVTLKRLPEGKYYVWVDELAGDEGAFTLDIDAVTPPPSPCLSATAIDVTSGTGTATGSTLNTPNYTQGTCGGSTSNDTLFKFTTTGDQMVTITVTPTATSTDYIPIVYLRSMASCDSEASADQLACDASSSYTTGSPASILFKDLPAGTYAVWIDGDEDYSYYGSGGPTNGDFDIEVKLDAPVLPPANDVCGTNGAGAVVLTKGAAAVSGDTTDAKADYGDKLSAACYAGMVNYNAKGNDLVYAYTPAAAGSFDVVVTPGSGFNLAVWYTTGTCGGDGQTCVDAADKVYSGSAETLTIAGVAGTTYYLYVDSYSTFQSGTFTIEIK